MHDNPPFLGLVGLFGVLPFWWVGDGGWGGGWCGVGGILGVGVATTPPSGLRLCGILKGVGGGYAGSDL